MTPTPEGKQLAADLANAERSALGLPSPGWQPHDFSDGATDRLAFARLATEHLALKAKHEEALADLREIDALLENAPDSPSVIADAKAIAAKWRVETDPLLEAMSVAMCGVAGEDYTESAKALRAELSKRGYEIGRKS